MVIVHCYVSSPEGTLYCICIVSGCASEQIVVVGDESEEDVLKYFIYIYMSISRTVKNNCHR